MAMRRMWGRIAVVVALVAATATGIAQEARHAQHESKRDEWQKVPDIFEAMAIKPGSVVADLGAGDGFFTARLSKAVGAEGRVFAIDVAADAVRKLRARVAEESLTNVEVIEGVADDPKLAAASVDAVLIVNAYHEMDAHQPLLSRLKAALKPGGRLVIVEPIADSRRDRPRSEQTRSHEIAADFVKKDLADAGFVQVTLRDPFATRPGDRDTEWMLVASPATPATIAAAAWSSSKNENWQAADLRISRDDYKRLVDAGRTPLALDVRDDRSFRDGHLPGAVLMEISEALSPDGVAKLKAEGRPIVTYCSCEVEQTSARIAVLLRKQGIQNVHALVGGYEEWLRAGERVERGKQPNQLQTSNSKLQTPNFKRRADLFEAFGVWSLEFGVVKAEVQR